eukprot:463463-Prymnesium_polylepis.1
MASELFAFHSGMDMISCARGRPNAKHVFTCTDPVAEARGTHVLPMLAMQSNQHSKKMWASWQV